MVDKTKGRYGDTETGHLAVGEIVVPQSVQSPGVMAILDAAFAAKGVDPQRYQVGAPENSRNPITGAIEFFDVGGADASPGGDVGADAAGNADVGGPSDGMGDAEAEFEAAQGMFGGQQGQEPGQQASPGTGIGGSAGMDQAMINKAKQIAKTVSVAQAVIDANRANAGVGGFLSSLLMGKAQAVVDEEGMGSAVRGIDISPVGTAVSLMTGNPVLGAIVGKLGSAAGIPGINIANVPVAPSINASLQAGKDFDPTVGETPSVEDGFDSADDTFADEHGGGGDVEQYDPGARVRPRSAEQRQQEETDDDDRQGEEPEALPELQFFKLPTFDILDPEFDQLGGQPINIGNAHDMLAELLSTMSQRS